MKKYEVALEIAGPTAMWTRPDTGDAPVSYPAPTYGACKGIFEAVLWSQWAEVVPNRAEICRPIVYHTYNTNYGGILRKSKVIKIGASYQLLATVLVDVCYRLYAEVRSDPKGYNKHGRPGLQSRGTTNGAHAYQAVFERRMKQGKLFMTPFLGWSEFVPDYVGPLRPETRVCDDVDQSIPSMHRTCFPRGRHSNCEPVFDQNVRIEKGVLRYAQRAV